MATLNVFELTSEALKNAKLDESVDSQKKTTSRKKKVVKESAKRTNKKFKSFGKIPANKLRLESLSFIKEAEEDDVVIDYTPEEDVVLVIDPEMEETPETEAEAEEAAEELIGDYVCKCSICGANYVCDCDQVTEDLEVEEDECPVCGEVGDQIVVGEIAPVEVEADEEESDEDADTEDADEDEGAEDDSDVDVNVNVNIDDEDGEDEIADFDFEDESEDDEYEESISRAKRRTALRRESAKKPIRKAMRKESRKPVRPSTKNESRVLPRRSAKSVATTKAYNFDETTLNRMLTSFAKENYDNARFVKITKANCNKGRLTLEGVVVTTKGSKINTKFVAENFEPKAIVSAKFREIGPFTESAISRTPAFTVNFKTVGNTIKPVALKYDYVVKEGRDRLQVTGRVMNESMNRKPSLRGKRTK